MGDNLFGNNEKYVANRDDVVNREYNLMLKKGAFIVGGALTGVLTGAAIDPHLTITGLAVGGVGASLISDVVTKKETKALEIDQKMLASFTDGNQHWSEFRNQVLDPNVRAPVTPIAPQLKNQTKLS